MFMFPVHREALGLKPQQPCSSTDTLIALAASLLAALLLLVLIGLTVYLLWKRRQDQKQYHQLVTTHPTIPSCTPVLQTSPRSSYGLAEVPFFLPPCFKNPSTTATMDGWEEDEDEDHGEEHRHHTQRGSLTVSSCFPLGSLRPDLYRLPSEPSEWAQPSGCTVRLCFAVQYQQEREQLVVSLLQAANLPTHCQGNAMLVKLQLLPSDDRRHRQAKAHSKGCQPHFNDSFVFQVSSNSIEQCTLSLTVYSVDRLRKHQMVGRILFPLKHCELREASGKVLWRDLENESGLLLSKHGDIQLSLNYNQSLQRLTVVVLRARGLHCLGDAVSLGVVVIGPFMYARGRALEHWNEMVSKSQELVKQWHGLGLVNAIQSTS